MNSDFLYPLLERACQTPDLPALHCGAQTAVYGELAALAKKVAAGLSRLGIEPGARIALLSEPSLQTAAVIHGILIQGAVLVSLHPALPPLELASRVSEAQVDLVLHDCRYRAVAGQLQCTTAQIDGLFDAPSAAVTGLVGQAQVATLLFTSGTTGTPKRALLTHGNHAASAAASWAHLRTGPGDVWLSSLPLCHIGGLALLFRAARDGFAVDIHRRFDAHEVARALILGRITHVSFVARTLSRTLDAALSLPPTVSARGENPVFPGKIQAALVGGGPTSAELLRRARSAGLPVIRTYGLTEAGSQVATQKPGDIDSSCGRPLPGFAVKIAGVTESGEEGELLIRGPAVMQGYDGEPPRREDWFPTGDIGFIDPRGRLVLLSRRTNLIVTGGENVYPAQVEAVLQGHPAVADVCILGLPDADWGQRVVALVHPEETSSPEATSFQEDLMAWCRPRLARFQQPKEILLSESPLPRTASGKLLHREILRLAEESLAPRHGGMRSDQGQKKGE